jgi:hypothetical protein
MRNQARMRAVRVVFVRAIVECPAFADASFDGRVRQSVSKGAVRGWVVVSIALDDVCVSHKYYRTFRAARVVARQSRTSELTEQPRGNL